MFIGDLVGQPGIALFRKWAPILKEKHKLNAIIVNGENSANKGIGITANGIVELKEGGASIITTGNHAWDNKDVYTALNERNDVIRPANYPAQCPGKGYALFTVENQTVAIVNLHGRVFIKDLIDCPFKAAETIISFLQHKTKIIFIDFHAEATSEKTAFGFFLDGKVSGIFGTHTHVQTADERILPNGTGFITDLGCCGALNSVIGMRYEEIIKRLTIHNKFGKFMVETKGPMILCGIIIDINIQTGKAVHIERVRITDEEIERNFAQ